MTLKMKTLRGKFQIKSDIYVHCYVEVEDVTEQESRLFVGIKRRADTVVPIGTKIFLDADSINPKSRRSSDTGQATFERVSARVVKHMVYQGDDDTVHICTPIQHDQHPDRRAQERKSCEFKMHQGEGNKFRVENGSIKGLGLLNKSSNAITNMSLGGEYTLVAVHKGLEYKYPGTVKHIVYNWKTYEHRIGFELKPIKTQALETVLNVLIDPDYKIDLSGAQVDAATGKISGG